jgi:hypothetical protein
MNDRNVAAHWLNLQSGLMEIFFSGLCVGVWQINLIDGNNARNFFFIDDFDDFHSLLFNTLCGRYNQYHKICHFSSSLSHVGEGFVARSVDESNFLPVAFDVEGSNFLCDSAMPLFSDVRIPEIIDEGSFAMINMTHDGYNWRFLFRLEFLTGIEVGSVDDADNFELLFRDYIIFGVYHLFSQC